MLRRYLSRAGWWVPATAVGLGLGGLSAAFVDSLILNTASDGLRAIVAGSLLGAICGALQWLVLRRYIANAGSWVLITIAAYSIGGVLDTLFAWTPATASFVFALISALLGGLVGTAQWLFLRHHFARIIVWVPTTTLTLAVMLFLLNVVVNDNYSTAYPATRIVIVALSAVVGGSSVSAAMVWRQRDRLFVQPTEEDVEATI